VSNGTDLDNGRICRKTSNVSVFTSRLYQSGNKINAGERDIPMTSNQIASHSTDEQNPALLDTIDVQGSTEDIKLQDTGNAGSHEPTISIELGISRYEGDFLHQQLLQALLPLHIAALKAYLLK
jgi:hypothetical protein